MASAACVKIIINSQLAALAGSLEEILNSDDVRADLGGEKCDALLNAMAAADIALLGGGQVECGYLNIVHDLVDLGVLDDRVYRVLPSP
jgi:hypothetical protein